MAGGASGLAAQSGHPPLEFLGVAPAMSRTAAVRLLDSLGVSLSCRPTREPRLTACEGRLAGTPEALGVTLSVVDDRVAIAMVSGRMPADRIAEWHADLVARFGEPVSTRRPGQESFQWVRDAQMLRLTVRREAGGLAASISLVDGPLLDGLPPP